LTNARGAVKSYNYVQHRAPFSRETSPLLIVCLYLAYSKLLKLTTALNPRDVWKTCDCRRVSGRQLEITCRPHSNDMQPTVSSNDAWYTNAALPRINSRVFVTGDIANQTGILERYHEDSDTLLQLFGT